MKPVVRAFIAAFVAALAGSSSAASADAELIRKVDAWRTAHEKDIVFQLDELVRFPSIAAEPKGVAAAAGRLETWLKARGFETAQLSDGVGTPPVVFGSLATPGAKRTIVFYAHYDGQPVTPSQWTGDPFVPVMRNGPLDAGGQTVDWKDARAFNPEWRLFGRATSDDKASVIAFLAAFDALKASDRAPSVNIKVVWEGEEESGSPHLEHILRANKERLAGDLWLIGDGPVHQSRRRMISFGARGVTSVEMTLYGPVRALHDGHYGNWVPNPAAMAADLIAAMRAPDGRILIPHFGDEVRPLTPSEKAAIAAVPPVEDQLRHEFGIAKSETGEGIVASIMRPALNVRGIRAGQVGAEAANAIPSDAAVSIDFRLVPDQTPARVRAAVEAFLRARGWTIVTQDPDASTRTAHARIVKLEWDEGYPAFRSDMSSPAAKAVIAAANDAAGGKVVLMPMMGGSVPIYLFADVFKVPVIGLPIANHDNNQHAANENLRLQNLWDGIETYAALMAETSW